MSKNIAEQIVGGTILKGSTTMLVLIKKGKRIYRIKSMGGHGDDDGCWFEDPLEIGEADSYERLALGKQ